MKTFIEKLSITTITIIALAALITFSAHTARTVGRQKNAPAYTEAAAPGNYGEVVNSLFGR